MRIADVVIFAAGGGEGRLRLRLACCVCFYRTLHQSRPRVSPLFEGSPCSHVTVVVGAETVGVIVVSPPKPVRVVAQDVRVVAAVGRTAVAASAAKGLDVYGTKMAKKHDSEGDGSGGEGGQRGVAHTLYGGLRQQMS